MVSSDESVSIIANLADIFGIQGREGVVIVKTKMAILIAHYKDGMIAGNTATTVEQLADYLIKTGY
jgi:profilin